MKTKKQIDSLAKKGMESLPNCFKPNVWKDGEWQVTWNFGDVEIRFFDDSHFRAYFNNGDFSVISFGLSPMAALNAVFVAVAVELGERTAAIEEVGSFFKELERQCALKSVTAKCRLKSARRRTN